MPPKKKQAATKAAKGGKGKGKATVEALPVDDRFKKNRVPYYYEPASTRSFSGPRNNRSVYPFIRGAITANADYNPIVQSLSGQKLLFDPNAPVPIRNLNFDEFGRTGDGTFRDAEGDVVMAQTGPTAAPVSAGDNPFNEPRPIPTTGDADIGIARGLTTAERSMQDLVQQLANMPAQSVPEDAFVEPQMPRQVPRMPAPETPRGLVDDDDDDDDDDEEPLRPVAASMPVAEVYQAYENINELPRAPIATGDGAGPSGVQQELPEPGSRFFGQEQQAPLEVPTVESGELLPPLRSSAIDDILSRRSFNVDAEQSGVGTRDSFERRPSLAPGTILPQRRPGAETDSSYKRIVRQRTDNYMPIVPEDLTAGPSPMQASTPFILPDTPRFATGLSSEAYEALQRRRYLSSGDSLEALLLERSDIEAERMKRQIATRQVPEKNPAVEAIQRRRLANSYTRMESDRVTKRSRTTPPQGNPFDPPGGSVFNIGSYDPPVSLESPRRVPRGRTTMGPLPDLPTIVPQSVADRLARAKRREGPVPRGVAQYQDLRGPPLKKRETDTDRIKRSYEHFVDVTRR
jgi:hypothetical protein